MSGEFLFESCELYSDALQNGIPELSEGREPDGINGRPSEIHRVGTDQPHFETTRDNTE